MENFFDFSPLKIVFPGHFSLGKPFPELPVPNEKRKFTSEKMLRFCVRSTRVSNEKTARPNEDLYTLLLNRKISLEKKAGSLGSLAA